MPQLRQSDACIAHAVDCLPNGAIAPHSGQATGDLETWAVQSYRRLLDIMGDRHSLQPADHAHARMLLLGLLCIPIYHRRGLLAVHWQSLKPDEFALSQLLTAANHQYGLAFPVAALPPLSPEANAAVFALLRSLWRCYPYPVVRLGQLYEQCLAWAPPDRGDVPSAALKSAALKSTALNIDSRKARGAYYTPEPLVDYCVSQTLGRLLGNPVAQSQGLSGLPRLLDPAAGGGAFLLAAYDALLRWAAGLSADSASVEGATVPRCTQQPPIAPRNCPMNCPIDCPIDYPANCSIANCSIDYPVGCLTDDLVDWQTRQQLLLDCIYGVDVDKTAIALTRLSLHLKLLEGKPPPGFVLPDLAQNLVCADALLGLDWAATFPAAVQAGGFDGVLGNPPYIDAEQMSATAADWRRACTQRYSCARGNWDLFCVFIERSLELCRPGGMTSLVVPNKLRSAGYAAAVRSLLTKNSQLVALRDYAQVAVFRAAVYPLVYVARRKAAGKPGPGSQGKEQDSQDSAGAPVPYEVMESLTEVRQRRWLYARGEAWWLGDLQRGGSLMSRLQQFPTLGQIASVRGAATVAEAYALQRWICNHPRPAAGDLRLVNSGTIDPYSLRWGDRPLRYLGDRYLHPILPAQFLHQLSPQRQQQATQPKLIVAGMTRRLECALDESGGILAGKSTSVIQAPMLAPIIPAPMQASGIEAPTLRGPNRPPHRVDCPDLLWLLLAILNSSLIHWFFVQRQGGNALQGGYLRVGPPQLRQIPIALGDEGDRPTLCHTLVDLAKQRQRCGTMPDLRAIAQLDAEIDAIVYALYGLSAADIAEIHADTRADIRAETGGLAD
jgi:hypothetical protein